MKAKWLCGLATPLVAMTGRTAELRMPPEMATDEQGRFVLTVQQADYRLVNGPEHIQTRSFSTPDPDALLVGPTLRVKPGSTVRLHFTNAMHYADAEGDAFDSPTVPHGFDVINLHVHGMHVSPRDNSDNVLLNILPADTPDAAMKACGHENAHDVAHHHICVKGVFDYEFRIPADHPAGTYWYHPQKHGAVAEHLGRGLAGALIVEDDVHGLDSLPAVQDVKRKGREKLLVLQEIVYAPDSGSDGAQKEAVTCSSVYSFFGCNYGDSDPLPKPGNVNLKLAINGQFDATVSMEPGEAQLWRVVNTTVGNVVPLCLVPAVVTRGQRHGSMRWRPMACRSAGRGGRARPRIRRS